MALHSVQETFDQGIEYLKRNRIQEASNAFRQAIRSDPENPLFLSYYGLVVALGEQNFQDAINFCRAALLKAAYDPELYVNLCRVYTKAGQRKKALETLLQGLHYDRGNFLLMQEMKRMGCRRKPILGFLSRDHFLNKTLGRLTHQLSRNGRLKRSH
jgi:tetratricopeptide (TPR) repeat protein